MVLHALRVGRSAKNMCGHQCVVAQVRRISVSFQEVSYMPSNLKCVRKTLSVLKKQTRH